MAGIFAMLSRYAAKRLARAGIYHPAHMFGLHQTGQISEDYLLKVIGGLSPGVTELYCHLGERDDETRRWWPAEYQPEMEVAAVTSPQVRACLEANRVSLTSYKDLPSP